MKNMNELALKVTRAEGKKKSISIAQVKEVLKIVSKLCAKNSGVVALLIRNGQK